MGGAPAAMMATTGREVSAKKLARHPAGIVLSESPAPGANGLLCLRIDAVERTSPLVGQVAVGDQVLRVNGIDVRSFAAAKAAMFDCDLLTLTIADESAISKKSVPQGWLITATKAPNSPVGVDLEEAPAPAGHESRVALRVQKMKPASPLHSLLTVGDLVLQINGVNVTSFNAAKSVLFESCALSLLVAPAEGTENGEFFL